jgi:2'-5' RNA ligase
MVQALEFFFDSDAEDEIRGLWRRLEHAGVSSPPKRAHRPHLTFAAGSSFSAQVRAELTTELRLLSLPRIWLYTLGTFATNDNELFLGSIVDTELLAVHSAVHDILAKKVRNPSAYYLPGSWVPHCTLAHEVDPSGLAAGFAALHPVRPVHARLAEVGITDTATGSTELLLQA